MTAASAPATPAEAVRITCRASARQWTDTWLRPRADAYDRVGRIPGEVLDAVADAGLWAPFLPTASGGSGISYGVLAEVHEEVGRGCSSLRSLLTVHSMVAFAVHKWGTSEQRERWLPQLASGRLLGALCVSEPQAGSDTAAIAATAEPTAGGWVLEGTKTWITGGQLAGLLLVFARTPDGVAAFAVPAGTPGVRVEPIEDMLGTRAAMLATVELGGAVVPDEALLGPAAFGAAMVLTGVLDIGRLSVAAGSVGILQACLDAGSEHTSRRTAGGVPLRELPLIRAKISDMVTDTAAARLLCAEAARLKDAGDSATIMATMVAKYFASTAAARHASAAVQLHGAHGCAPGSTAARLYRDAKVMEIIEGSSEIQQLAIADVAYRNAC